MLERSDTAYHKRNEKMIEDIQPFMVYIVSMLMVGWYLSRNKLLFLSCAIFITVVVGVHLAPSFTSFVELDHYRDSCTDLVNEIVWDVKPKNNSPESYDKNWDWVRSGKVSACEFQKFSKGNAKHLLNGSWVVLAGDSEMHLLLISLLRLVLDEKSMHYVSRQLYKRQSDYNIVLDEIGMKVDFKWRPFETNLTHLIMEFKVNRTYPDILVMGSGLWHMLRINNASDYTARLLLLKKSLVSSLTISPELGPNGSVTSCVSNRLPHLFWLGMPVLVYKKLTTQAKRAKLNDAKWHAYDEALRDSKLLRQTGGPLTLLDFQSVTRNCGPLCTSDGMHYHGTVYGTLVQIMLNDLVNESQQRLRKQ